MVRIFSERKDIYESDAKAPLKCSGKAYYKGRIYTFHRHIKKLEIGERLSQILGGISLTFLSGGIALLFSSKVREWMRGAFLGKNIIDVYLPGKMADQNKREKKDFWNQIVHPGGGHPYKDHFSEALIKSSIENCQYEKIYFRPCYRDISDLPFTDDGTFRFESWDPNKKYLLMFVSTDEATEKRLTKDWIMELCTVQPSLKEFCEKGNDIYVMKFDDACRVPFLIPKDLKKLIEG